MMYKIQGQELNERLVKLSDAVAQAGGLDHMTGKSLKSHLTPITVLGKNPKRASLVDKANILLERLQGEMATNQQSVFELGQADEVYRNLARRLVASTGETLSGAYLAKSTALLASLGSEWVKKGYKPGSMRIYTTRLRKLFKECAEEAYGEMTESCQMVYNHIPTILGGFYNQEVIARKREYEKEVVAKTSNRTVVDWSMFDGLFEEVHDILDNRVVATKTAWTTITTYLCLVTGRRLVEVLSGYTQLTPQGDYQMLFKGQAKDKGDSIDLPPYTIPTLDHTSYIVKAINWLESMGKISHLDTPLATKTELQDHRKKLHNRVSKAMSGAVKARFKGKGVGKVHDLRKVYANVCRRYHNTQDTVDDYAYMASILGHGTYQGDVFTLDPNTANVYSGYSIENYTQTHETVSKPDYHA